MYIRSRTFRGAFRLAETPELSRPARQRLKWMDYYREHDGNARLTCRHFDISPQTFYRWKRRYDPKNLLSLEDHLHRPHRLRQPTWSPELAQAVFTLREQYPRWGKDKLAVLLRNEHWQVSISMVGRILTQLKKRRLLREPPRNSLSTKKRRYPRLYAMRKPKDYPITQAGDLVQVDTLDVRPLPGVVFKNFTARDVISRWDVLEVHTKATSSNAVGFLDTLVRRMPFPLKAIQVDGGSEFEAAFEQECQKRGIRLFVLPPRSPKLNGHVERANRTHTEEFYELYDGELKITSLNKALQEWETVYNHIRPHQALGYLTPQQFLLKCRQKKTREDVSPIT
jgi:putative transposase